MNRSRPGYLVFSLCLAPLVFSLQTAATQTAATPTAATELTPSELYRDTKVLRVVTELDLTRSQIEKILPVAQTVTDQALADREADDHDYELIAEAAEAVIAALTKGDDPPPKEMSLLDGAARKRNEREDFRAGLAADAASKIQRMLTRQQASRIETAAEQAERNAVEQRLEGSSSPLDYIVAKLQEQMELMPDEYLRVREQRAWDMAEAILVEGSARIQALARDLLAIMDQVASWTPEQYEESRAKLRSAVAERLGLPQEEAPKILYEDFIAWITSDRTPVVLRELLTIREPEAEGVTP
jgi:vacuolar-type H+-ATPase subunit H